MSARGIAPFSGLRGHLQRGSCTWVDLLGIRGGLTFPQPLPNLPSVQVGLGWHKLCLLLYVSLFCLNFGCILYVFYSFFFHFFHLVHILFKYVYIRTEREIQKV